MKDLLTEYVPRVYRFALRLTRDSHAAEEIVQETMLRAWRRRRRLRDAEAIRPWLFRIAANVWRDRLRRAELEGRTDDAEPNPETGCQPSPDSIVAQRDEVRSALAWMDALPPRQRQVLYLHAIEQMSHTEIADVLEMSDQAVKTNLSLARGRMREKLARSHQTKGWDK